MNVVVLYYLVVSFLVVVPNVQGSSCDVVPFTLWAGSPKRHNQDLKKPLELVVVTHTVTRECNTDQDCEAIIRAIRNNHLGQGHLDITLSFLVGGNGKIYEGAGWKVGGHSHGYNDKSISLSFIGDFRTVLPSAAALKAAEQFLGCFLNTRNIACEYTLVGHRQLINTISPGDALHNLIQTWPHWSQVVPVTPH